MKPTAARLAWLALAITLLAGITWGAYAQYSWDVDNIAPGSVLKAMAARFGPEWFSSYGPVPYQIVAAIYAPALAILKLTGELGTPSATYPWGFRHPDDSMFALIVLARGVCVVLALVLAMLATRERWAGGKRDAWLVPLLLAGSPTFTYYARTSNVDLFYLFFLALAFHFAERASRRTGLALGGAAAALAVSCKEQSAPLAVVAGATAAWRAAVATTASLGERARAVLGVLACAVAAYAIVWMLPFHLAGWRAHHRFIFEQARYPRVYAADAAGFASLGRHVVELLPLTLGWSVLVGATLALVLERRDALRGVAPRLIAAALYGFGFLAVIGYVYPRFLLPVLLFALPLAVRGWSALLDRAGRWTPLAVTALLALMSLGGPLLGLTQANDTRLLARRWLLAHVPEGTRVEVAGNPRFQVALPSRFPLLATIPDSLRRMPRGPRGDAVLVSGFDRYVFQRDPALRAAWWDSLELGYRGAAEFHGPRWAHPVRGLPISPSIYVWLREPSRP